MNPSDRVPPDARTDSTLDRPTSRLDHSFRFAHIGSREPNSQQQTQIDISRHVATSSIVQVETAETETVETGTETETEAEP